MSSAQMNGYLSEWAVLKDEAKNESFNTSDDCPFTWGKFWPKLAARFGMPWTGSSSDPSLYQETTTPYDPPPRGFGPPAKIRCGFTLTEWAKKPEVQRAWGEIAKAHKLRDKKLGDVDIDRTFGYLDVVLSASYPVTYSTTKSKKLGFFGFVDSTESIFKVIEEFMDLKMVTPLS